MYDVIVSDRSFWSGSGGGAFKISAKICVLGEKRMYAVELPGKQRDQLISDL